MSYKVGDKIVITDIENTPYRIYLAGMQNRDGYLVVQSVIICNTPTSNINDSIRCQSCAKIKYRFFGESDHNMWVVDGYCDDYLIAHSTLYSFIPAKPQKFKLK